MMRKKVVVLKKTEGSGARTRTRVGSVVHYVECRKNHAAKFGGFVVDGCREFMATGEDGTEEAFFCDACGCHRSFHRREVNAEVVIEYHPPNPNH